MPARFLSDKEVASALGVSVTTVWRGVNGRLRVKGLDLRDAAPIYVGSRRRWDASKLAALLGVTTGELLEML